MNSAQPLLPARYASRVAISGVANGAVSAVCAALALPLLVTLLGLETYGQWALLGMFITTGAALDLGLSRAIVLTCAGQPSIRVRECVTAAAMLAGSLAVLATLLISIITLASGRLLGFAPAGFDTNMLVGGCTILAIGMGNGVLRAALESQLGAHWVNVGYLVQTLLYYGLTLLAARFWRDGIVVAPVAALACILVLNAVLLARAGLLRPIRPRAATLGEMLKAGRQSYLLAAPIAVLPPLAAMLVLGQVPDPAAYGTFDLAFRVAILASTLLSSIAVPVLALAARAHASGVGVAQLQEWVRRYLLLGWALYGLGMLTMWLAGPWLLGGLFPSADPGLFPMTLALLGGMGAVAANEAATRAMLGSRHPAPVLVSRLVMLAVVLTVGAWMLTRGGVIAFAQVYLAAGLLASAMVLGAWLSSRRAQ